MSKDMISSEALKAVFPILDGEDLVSCMLVCRQWKEIAKDDYFWKCICAKRWPSICKRPPPAISYHKFFVTFGRSQPPQPLPPSRLSFLDLEFFIDLWSEQTPIFSEVISSNVLQRGIKNPPPGISEALKVHLESDDYKMIMQVEPRFSFSLGQTISVSVFASRKDTNQIARIMNHSLFGYVDGNAFRAMAFDYLKFAPGYPFISGIRAWVSFLFLANNNHSITDVFGIEIDFCDAARSENEVLWLLDMLDWK